jgi:hypothetical protein
LPDQNAHCVKSGPSLKSSCINHLRQIDGAKEQWALENHKKPKDIVTTNDIAAYIKGGMPKCPQGGIYIIGRVGTTPHCTFPGHTL